MPLISLERPYKKALCAYVQIACKHPLIFIMSPFVIFCLLAPCILAMKKIIEPIILLGPSDGRALKEREDFANLFPNSSVMGRQTRMSRFGVIIVTLSEIQIERNIFNSSEALKELVDLDSFVHQNISVDHQDKVWFYKDLCARHNFGCYRNPGIQIAKNKSGRILYPFDIDQQFGAVYYGMVLGKVTTDQDSHAIGAEAIMLHYLLRIDMTDFAELSLEWEKVFVKKISSFPSKNLAMNFITSHSLAYEIDEVFRKVPMRYAIGGTIMILFAFCACYHRDCVRSKSLIGIASINSSGMASLSAFGACILCGIPYLSLNIGVPFLMMGIGLDDIFVILSVWSKTPGKTVEERMTHTFDHCGISITITSLTNIVSFSMGIFTPFAALSLFCIYMVAAMVFLYIFQMTFLLGILVLSARREMAGLNAFCFLPVYQKDKDYDSRSFFQKYFCTSFVGDKANMGHSLSTRIFGDHLGGFICKPKGKLVVALSYCGYLLLSLYGIVHINTQIKLYRTVKDDSYCIPFLKSMEEYFYKYPYRIQVALKEELDYSSPEVQKEVEEVVAKFESIPYIVPNLTEFWLPHYKRFLSRQEVSSLVDGGEKGENFYYLLRRIFLRVPAARPFAHDIVFNENGTKILHSRFYIQTGEVRGAVEENDLIARLNEVVDSSTIKVGYYNDFFPYLEHNIKVIDVALWSIFTAAAAVFIVLLLFIQNVMIILWVGLALISLELGIVGFLTYLNISFDSTAIMIQIMCIGFSVDSCVHVTYSFKNSKKTTVEEKLKDSLGTVGIAIVKTALSCVLGCSNLYFFDAYAIYTFFKMVVILMVFAVYHSLLVLPMCIATFHYDGNRKVCNKKAPLSPDPVAKTNNCTLKSVKPISNGPTTEQTNKVNTSSDMVEINLHSKENLAYEKDEAL